MADLTVSANIDTLMQAADFAAAKTSLGLGTGDSPQFTAVNVGAASDTTISRVSAGVIAVEGVTIATLTGTETFTNKTLTSPTLTTPALGTPASGTLTNCTAVPSGQIVGVIPIANLATGTPNGSKFIRDDGTLQAISGGGDALVANPLSQFASTTSAQLAGVLSDETGSGGGFVRATAPTISAPTISGIVTTDGATVQTGTAVSGNAIDVTKGLNTHSITGNVTVTFTGTPTTRQVFGYEVTADSTARTVTLPANVVPLGQSSALASFIVPASSTLLVNFIYDGTNYRIVGNPALTTGTGSYVLDTSPTLVTPALGTPTALVLTNATGLPVAGGGTGRATSTTAYGLIAAGTTATGAHQTLAAGATTEVLVGGGASALPVWTTATGSGAPVRATSPTITTPTIAKLANLTSNGFVRTSGGDGTLSVSAAITPTISMLNPSVTPDTTGEAFFEPYTILATNDIFKHTILRFGSSNSAQPTVDHGVYGVFTVPADYSAGASILIKWTATITSGDVYFVFSYRNVAVGASLDQTTFQQASTVTATAPGTANLLLSSTISPTAGNFVAGDVVEFFFHRDGSNGADTMAGSAIVQDLRFSYTTP